MVAKNSTFRPISNSMVLHFPDDPPKIYRSRPIQEPIVGQKYDRKHMGTDPRPIQDSDGLGETPPKTPKNGPKHPKIAKNSSPLT